MVMMQQQQQSQTRSTTHRHAVPPTPISMLNKKLLPVVEAGRGRGRGGHRVSRVRVRGHQG